MGENGSGKSTLLEAIAVACGFNPEGGTKNYIFRRAAGEFIECQGFYNSQRIKMSIGLAAKCMLAIMDEDVNYELHE